MSTRKELAEARMRKGWSQEDLAEKLGVHRNTVSDWERGVKAPYPTHVKALCELYGMTSEELGLHSNHATDDLVISGKRIDDIIEQCAIGIKVCRRLSNEQISDDLLAVYDCGISACRDLFFGGNPQPVQAILPLYCHQTALLAQEASTLRQPAAKLASHAQRLACELAIDREDFGLAEQSGKEAFRYGRLADDANLQIAALINLANLAFHRKLDTAALATYQQAVALLSNEVTPLLKGRTYAGLAEIYAMRGQFQDAMRAMGNAYTIYPEKPEDDPAYQYTRYSRYALYVFGDAQSRLFLGQPKEAETALTVMQRETKDPEFEPITRLDMLYYQADVHALQGDLERSNAVLTEGALLAKELGSKLYFNKLAVTYHDLRLQKPREPRVLALEEVFQPW